MYGLYVHIPFCLKKCKYCDFVSFDNREELKEKYLDKLIEEMGEYRGFLIDTVFIGGGTPTSLNAHEIKKLLLAIRGNFQIKEDAEFTMEANPKTLDEEKLSIMKMYGVNRLSIGVQSFCDNELFKIGRIHNAEIAKETIALVRENGFKNINIDLMFALPDQTMESFKKSLEAAVENNISHISCYSLILEEKTPLYEENKEGKLVLPDEDTERKMYDYACEFLEKNGYEQYEISNFAKKGYKSRHNIKYWKCNEYIGIGLGAHSYLSGERFQNTEEADKYLSGEFHLDNREALTLSDKIAEFMIMGLRMRKGIEKKEFSKRFGMEIEAVYKKELDKFLKSGFLIEEDGNVFISKEGISVSNSIMCEFAICNVKIND